MNRKILVSLIITLFAIFSFSVCFANSGNSGLATTANNVRNFVGGVEDTVENVALDISNVSKDVTGGTENVMSNNRTSGMNNSNRMTGSNMGSGYTATRTSTDTTSVAGMSQTAWTWLILGITAIAIIAVVWYYSMQFTNTGRRGNNNNNNDDEN